MIWLIVMISIIIVIIVLCSIPVKIELLFTYNHDKASMILKCLYLNKCVMKRNMSFKSGELQIDEDDHLSKKIEQLPSEISNVFSTLHNSNKNLMLYLQGIQIDFFLWRTKLGLEEAGLTSFLSGNVWAIKGMIVGLFAQQIRGFPKPKLYITPQFFSKVFETELNCIGSIRLGKAMYTIMKVKIKKKK